MTAMQNALFTTAMNYNKNAGTPFTNFLQGIELPVVKPGATQAETDAETKAAAEAATNANVNKALEEYKKTGLPPNVDQSISGQVQKAIDDYERQKAIDTANAKALAAQKAGAADRKSTRLNSSH